MKHFHHTIAERRRRNDPVSVLDLRNSLETHSATQYTGVQLIQRWDGRSLTSCEASRVTTLAPLLRVDTFVTATDASVGIVLGVLANEDQRRERQEDNKKIL